MKILVTGAAGFIGFHLVKQLIARGDEVIGLDSINDYYDTKLKYGRLQETGIDENTITYNNFTKSKRYSNYRFIQLKLEDRVNIERIFEEEKFDRVCHLAAQAGVRYSIENPHAYVDSNLVGYINVLDACRQHAIEHFVYASSSSIYGLNETVPFSTKNNTDHPVSLYAATKKANELMAHTYSHLYKLPTTGLRFFTVYGPWGRPDMAYFLFTKKILNGDTIDVYNFGKMQRDFTYVGDIVEGVIRVIDNPPKGNKNWSAKTPSPDSSQAPYKVYNIGNNAPVKLMEFIETIEKELGIVATKKLMPIQPGDVLTTWADVEDLIEDLDYKPSTSLAIGIEKFVTWYKSFYQVGTPKKNVSIINH